MIIINVIAIPIAFLSWFRVIFRGLQIRELDSRQNAQPLKNDKLSLSTNHWLQRVTHSKHIPFEVIRCSMETSIVAIMILWCSCWNSNHSNHRCTNGSHLSNPFPKKQANCRTVWKFRNKTQKISALKTKIKNYKTWKKPINKIKPFWKDLWRESLISKVCL